MRASRSVSVCLVVAGICAAAASASWAGSSAAKPGQNRVENRPVLARQIVGDLNRLRSRRGLPLLRVAPGLTAAASAHTREMVADGFFAHESADGSPFWQRVRRFYGHGGYRHWSVGETLLWVSPDVGAAETVADWLASPPHRRILLDPAWHEVGVVALHALSTPGDFEGLETTVITADFGARTR